VNLIDLLLARSGLQAGARVLDVGCGVGGTSRHLAAALGCAVTGVTISGRQVEIATRLTRAAATKDAVPDDDGFLPLAEGRVRFVELDAEKMGDYFSTGAGAGAGPFDAVWISEALSHFPDKALFFANAARLLRPGGRLVLADWFKAEALSDGAFAADIKPIEGRR